MAPVTMARRLHKRRSDYLPGLIRAILAICKAMIPMGFGSSTFTTMCSRTASERSIIHGRSTLLFNEQQLKGIFMRIGFAKFWPRLILFSALLEGPMVVNGQGTITFDGHSLWSGKNYTELGMQFQVVIPQGSAYDDMVVVPANWANNVPQDNTPFMGWFRQYN